MRARVDFRIPSPPAASAEVKKATVGLRCLSSEAASSARGCAERTAPSFAGSERPASFFRRAILGRTWSFFVVGGGGDGVRMRDAGI